MFDPTITFISNKIHQYYFFLDETLDAIIFVFVSVLNVIVSSVISYYIDDSFRFLYHFLNTFIFIFLPLLYFFGLASFSFQIQKETTSPSPNVMYFLKGLLYRSLKCVNLKMIYIYEFFFVPLSFFRVLKRKKFFF